MYLEEGLEFAFDGVLHLGGECEMEWAASYWLEVLGYVVDRGWHEDGGFVEGQLASA